MNTLPAPAPDPAPLPCSAPARFEPENVVDLLRPIESIIESVARDFQGQDLCQAEARSRFIVTVDRVLLAREPWSQIVPVNIREALVARLLRTYWWGQGGVLDTGTVTV